MAQPAKPQPPTAPGALSTPPKMTYEEFLEWVEDGTRAEWVNGEVIILSPSSTLHQRLAAFLTPLLQLFAEVRHAGLVLPPPFQMKTGPELPGREPDIIFIARENLGRLQDTYLDGPADLVVEIISADSRTRDRGEKFYEYEQGGVREYWLLDPQRKQAEFYRLDEDRFYHLVPIGEDGIFHSAVLEGLWLKVDWLWQQPLPPLMSVLKEWKLV